MEDYIIYLLPLVASTIMVSIFHYYIYVKGNDCNNEEEEENLVQTV